VQEGRGLAYLQKSKKFDSVCFKKQGADKSVHIHKHYIINKYKTQDQDCPNQVKINKKKLRVKTWPIFKAPPPFSLLDSRKTHHC
jgi:hypothetical protein